VNSPFAYSGETPIETAYISYPQLTAVFDFRDDPIDTHSGIIVGTCSRSPLHFRW